jgi:hypothetical protein
MRYSAFLFGAILLFTASAGAQVNPRFSVQSASSGPEAVSLRSLLDSSPTFALALSPIAAAPWGTPGLAKSDSSASSDPAAQQPTVYGVYQIYDWQLYADYTFVRFYEAPNVTPNLNGLDFGLVYFPGGRWIGAEGQLVAAFGSQPGACGCTAKFLLAMGGPRFRWAQPRGVELWAHGLVGGSHFLPQTPYGGQSAFAYQVGGGIDISANRRRLAYRVGADMVGTHYFGTYQISPRLFVGIVFKYQ